MLLWGKCSNFTSLKSCRNKKLQGKPQQAGHAVKNP